MASISNEARIILAIEAIEKTPKLSIQAAAKTYNVANRTIRRRLASKPAQRDTTPNSRRLTDSEENAIVQYVIELDAQAFPPRLHSVEDIANQLLCVYNALPVGKL